MQNSAKASKSNEINSGLKACQKLTVQAASDSRKTASKACLDSHLWPKVCEQSFENSKPHHSQGILKTSYNFESLPGNKLVEM